MRLLHICVVSQWINGEVQVQRRVTGPILSSDGACLSLRSPALSSRLQPEREPGGQGQRDSELQVRSREARPAVQVDQGRARV